jgi:hypothetical protein
MDARLMDRSHSSSLVDQGGWEDDEDVHEAACREALEEAGVKGAIDVRKLIN